VARLARNGSTVAVVGPCASGKSTLVCGLRRHGYLAREVAQEHSVVPDLWRRRGLAGPLVFLDVSPHVACDRRGLAVPPRWWRAIATRLDTARRSADVYVCTDALSVEQVLVQVLAFLDCLAPSPGAADSC
jgi:hypothetical protein